MISNFQENPIKKLKGYKFVNIDKNASDIPNTTGVYIWILKENATLPSIAGVQPSFNWVEVNNSKYRVLYVGLAKDENLTDRILGFHLKGNPRSSTLCYSIASILGLPLYGKVENSGKRRIQLDKEYWNNISDWLKANCFLLVKSQANPKIEETDKITLFTAPLNIMDNPHRKIDPYIVNLQKIRRETKTKDNPTKANGCMTMAIITLALTFLHMF